MSISISLCMIVKNEENNLARCLDSVKEIVDEINIVDTGSTDKTIDVAKRYTDRIYHFDWIDDFAAARNFSFEKAEKEYILWLDADDIITQENRDKFIELKRKLTPEMDVDYVTMPYHCGIDENGKVKMKSPRERLIKRSRGFTWVGAVHEAINVSGKGIEIDIFVTHGHKSEEDANASSMRNMRILEKAVMQENPRWRDLCYYGISLFCENQYDKALEVILQMMEMPNDSGMDGLAAYLAAYTIFSEKGDYESACHVLIDNEHLFCDKAEYYCELGEHYYKVEKKYDLAYEAYCKALKCKGNESTGNFMARNETCYYFMPYYRLGMMCCNLQMYKEAAQYLEKALEYDPQHEETISMLGKLRRLEQMESLR